MLNRFNISFFLIVLFSFGVQAQDFGKPIKSNPIQKSEKKPRSVVVEKKSVAILFRADHDFYLAVDDKKYSDRISANKLESIRLPVGVHKLSFEEADSTGETQERYFRVTPDMAKQKDSAVSVSFKNDFQAIMNVYSATAMTTVSHTASGEQDAQLKAIAKELSDSMVLKSGGSFTTTVKSGQKAGSSQVVTVHSLFVGKYEVTQRQWQAVMGSKDNVQSNCTNCPIDGLSWNDVNAFIEKLNKGSGKKFRLPTEVEWEYVTDQSIGNSKGRSSDPAINKDILKNAAEASAWYEQKNIHNVGEKEPLDHLYDLLGNAAEWCADGEGKKVFKGGSYKDKEEALRVSWRNIAAPNEKRNAVGFRLVRDAD